MVNKFEYFAFLFLTILTLWVFITFTEHINQINEEKSLEVNGVQN